MDQSSCYSSCGFMSAGPGGGRWRPAGDLHSTTAMSTAPCAEALLSTGQAAAARGGRDAVARPVTWPRSPRPPRLRRRLIN
ncbi:unnamed protein product, partial [Brenthis ino]